MLKDSSTVLDRSVGTITRAENGPLTISEQIQSHSMQSWQYNADTLEQRLTAREVFEVHPRPDGKYTVKVSQIPLLNLLW